MPIEDVMWPSAMFFIVAIEKRSRLNTQRRVMLHVLVLGMPCSVSSLHVERSLHSINTAGFGRLQSIFVLGYTTPTRRICTHNSEPWYMTSEL